MYIRPDRKVVIPIQNVTVNELNDDSDIPDKKNKSLISFFCIITILISSLFCCITL